MFSLLTEKPFWAQDHEHSGTIFSELVILPESKRVDFPVLILPYTTKSIQQNLDFSLIHTPSRPYFRPFVIRKLLKKNL